MTWVDDVDKAYKTLGSQIEYLKKKADEALYLSKEKGRNTYTYVE